MEELKRAAVDGVDDAHVKQTMHAALSHLNTYAIASYVNEAATVEDDCATAVKEAEENALTLESAATAVEAARALC